MKQEKGKCRMFYMKDKYFNRLKQYADEKDISMSQVLRDLIRTLKLRKEEK